MNTYNLNKLFELNGISYKTDWETLNVLREIIQSAKNANDGSAVQAVIALGLKSGRIMEHA